MIEPDHDSFSKVEYLIIFNAILFGFIAAEFFLGWGKILRYKAKIERHWWVHILWTMFGFGLLLDMWWSAWLRGYYISDNIAYFHASLITPIIFYLISMTLFPPNISDYKEYFLNSKKLIYGLFGFLLLSNGILAYLFQESELIEFENVFRLLGVILAIFGIYSSNLTFHKTLIIVACVALAFHHVLLVLHGVPPFSTAIDGYSFVEYLITFYAIIFGIVTFEYLYGWGSLIIQRNQIQIYWVYLLWTFFAFSLLIDLWWLSWSRRAELAHNFEYFIILLLPPLIFYFGSVILFPDFEEKKNQILKLYFYKKKSILFGMFIFYFLINILCSVLFSEYLEYPMENKFRVAAIIFATSGVIINNQVFHKILVILSFGALLTHHIITYYAIFNF